MTRNKVWLAVLFLIYWCTFKINVFVEMMCPGPVVGIIRDRWSGLLSLTRTIFNYFNAI